MESEGDEEARKLCRKNNEKRGRRKVTLGKAQEAVGPGSGGPRKRWAQGAVGRYLLMQGRCM